MALPKADYRVISDAIKSTVEADSDLYHATNGPIKLVDTELRGDLAMYPVQDLPVLVIRPDGKREDGEPRELERAYRYAAVLYARSAKLDDIANTIQDIAGALELLFLNQWDAATGLWGIGDGELTGYAEAGGMYPGLVDTTFAMGQYLQNAKRVGSPWLNSVAGLWYATAQIQFTVTYVASIDVN